MTTSTFQINSKGAVVLPDGQPLPPPLAFALADFVRDNTVEIEQAAATARTGDAYVLVGSLVANGLPLPQDTISRWDGKLVVGFRTDEAYDAWARVLDGTDEPDVHPTLGSRPGRDCELLVLQGAWDRKPADDTAPVPA